MGNRRRKVEIIFLGKEHGFTSVTHGCIPIEDNVDLVFAWILNRGADPLGVDYRFAITSYSDNNGGVRVSLAKQWLVMAGRRREIRFFLAHRGSVAIEKGRIDLSLVRMQPRATEDTCEQTDQYGSMPFAEIHGATPSSVSRSENLIRERRPKAGVARGLGKER